MTITDVRALLAKANPHVARCLEAAAGFTINRGHFEVTTEDLLLKLLETGSGDLVQILRHFSVDPGRFEASLLETIERFPTGNRTRPGLSARMLTMLERAYLVATVELDQNAIRSGSIVAAVRDDDDALAPYQDLLRAVPKETLRRSFRDIVAGSVEDRAANARSPNGFPVAQTAAESGAQGTALERFTIDFTARARSGEIDPVNGRDDEIRQMIDILSRRRKNNPIIVGEAGVGKTAVVEGLALRIIAGDVPEALRSVELRGLDLGLLQAGAGVKGEFENRLKTVIAEIKQSPVPIVTFIDEAHTLVGAGGAPGQGDAANLLKPALARGELRTVAATTWSEYKKYFEKDAALARRFQLVKVDEPDEARALIMLRGVKQKFEEAHGVRILDAAVVAAVRLAERYIAGRQLPDKAIDLIDTAAARVKIGLSSKPAIVEELERRIQHGGLELEARRRDLDGGTVGDDGELASLEQEIAAAAAELAEQREAWQRECAAVEAVAAARAGNGTVPAALEVLEDLQKDRPLVSLEVTPDVIAAVVSDWTGIPAGRMVRDQAQSMLRLATDLDRRVLGQEHVTAEIAKRLRAASSGLGNPDAPRGVFLLVGPSGVGKTETGLALADLLFGGERFLTTINMSEYLEAHTVSRLIGSPPGYVGYGEGGVLSEAVRQRPYSVVLLDEVEKAHPDVMNLFYQVFDKGVLNDGEGREIDFRNTVVLMTSNLGAEEIESRCCGERRPTGCAEVIEAIRPELRARFKPALLARMAILPLFPLQGETLRRIVDLKLERVARRLHKNARLELTYSSALADWITERCTVAETGARNIDAILQSEVLPGVSIEILQRMAEGEPLRRLHLETGDDGVLHRAA